MQPHTLQITASTFQARPPTESKDKEHVYSTAVGSPFDAHGEFKVHFTTQEGQKRHVTFQNAPVTVPILSSGKMCDEGNEITYNKKGVHPRRGHK